MVGRVHMTNGPSDSECEMILRRESTEDIEAITHVTVEAFKNHPVSHQTEQFIIDALRDAGVLAVSLVAEIDGRVVGHVAFSPVSVSDGTRHWYGLGPISVLPAHQRQGIGTSLVNAGLSSIRELGARGCVLVGDPGYYSRFGFKSYPDLVHQGVPQEFFLALPFNTCVPRGTVVFHDAFLATG